ncbi:hypothetical protein BO94DRAFT_233479 [Aspergillus sclerotioniger CBS 115572]|uniref:Uncharacterized protein n=1 Tax=Aspergillus sclerotioniger CBS 115572 TaxID=1450535 RepID=A0A317VIM1_9EURO|nr:hypothetical protein BO94DRAFT_233479 [Aspergillus sclerotioniger CBS 115572]PWY73775.1 hypothetical protein BO94DRAFT_233479 [Aspergillus sclerotioniger CBS 115572]
MTRDMMMIDDDDDDDDDDADDAGEHTQPRLANLIRSNPNDLPATMLLLRIVLCFLRNPPWLWQNAARCFGEGPRFGLASRGWWAPAALLGVRFCSFLSSGSVSDCRTQALTPLGSMLLSLAGTQIP